MSENKPLDQFQAGTDGECPYLFAPLELKGRHFQSRIVMTSHTTSLAEDGVPAGRMRDYYCERAAGGTGMIVVEPVPAHPTARHAAANFALDDRVIEPMRKLGEAVRAMGTVVIGQVYNLGSFANPVVSMRETWAPSPDRLGRMRHPSHAVTRPEIKEMVDGFVAAAARLASADLDGVEINMAYDGFIDSFFSPVRNHRDDEYGGSLVNRLRVAREVLTRTRDAIGCDRILGATITGDYLVPNRLHVDDMAEIAVALAEACDLDYLAVANADQVMNHFLIPGMEVERGYGAQWARVVKRALPGLIVTAQGRIQSPEVAEQTLREGAADLVGMARALIADPYLPRKARHAGGRSFAYVSRATSRAWDDVGTTFRSRASKTQQRAGKRAWDADGCAGRSFRNESSSSVEALPASRARAPRPRPGTL